MVRFFLLTGFFVFLQDISVAQNCVITNLPSAATPLNGSVINLPCGQNCTNIKFQIPHVKQTSDYIVMSIPYNPYPYLSVTGAEDPVLYADDQYSAIVNLPAGFLFPFYDSIFSKTVVGSNGLITFDMANASCANAYLITQTIPFQGGAICNAGVTYYPKASVMGAYSDLDPRTTASPADKKIQWHMEGTAPCRKFVISYYHVGIYGNNGCGLSTPNTFQMVIYESTGIIDVYFEQKVCYSSTNNGRGILGVQDWSRTRAVAAPGNNNTQWTAVNQAYRFVPSAGVSDFVNAELTTLSGTHVAWADSTTTTAGLLDLNFPNVCTSTNVTKFVVKTSIVSNTDPNALLYSLDTVTINRTLDLFATATSTASTCGPPTGTITVTVPAAAGTPPFMYTLDNPPGTSSPGRTYTFTNVSPGSHIVYVSDATGCGSTIPITVALNGTLPVTATSTPTACNGVNNGSITVTPPTGTPPFQYSINGGPYQANNTFTNLAPGNYTISVQDGGGCSGTTTVAIVVGPALTATTSSTATTCPGATNGTITITPTSGTGPYQYSMDGAAYQVSNTFTNVSSGTHFIVVKDALGCTSNTISVTVGQGPGLTGTAASTATTCAGVNNGTITVTPTSGTGPYQYYLDALPPQASNVFTNVSAGNHTVVFKDANGCSSNNIPVTVASGTGITGTTTSTGTSCPGVNNGTITVTPASGTAPYQYSLDGTPYQAGNTFTNVSAGSHTIVFQDALGCTSGNINVTVAAGTGITGTAASTATSCPGVNNGTITVTPTSGTAPYQYSLDGIPYQASNIFTNVSAGSHTIVFQDALGCTSASINVTVAAGAGITATAVTTATSCNGVSNGTITVTASSGTSPWQYSLDGSAYQASNVFTNVAAGSHTVVVKDAVGCTSANIPVTVAAGAGPTGTTTSTATSCSGVNNGTITVTPANGVTPYQYSLDGGAYQASNVFTNVSAGAHTVVVKDGVGCISANIAVTVAAGAGPSGTAVSTATSCNGASNGTVTATGSAGTAPYQFSLDGGAYQAGNTFTNVAAGNHNVVVKDAAGCISAQIPVTVAIGPPLTVTIVPVNTSCSGANNGTITLTPVNGNGPYQYSLNGGTPQAGNVFNNLAPGNYTVSVTDANGCTANNLSAVINAGAGLTATISQVNVDCNGNTNGSVTINVNAPATPPYQYSLDNITFQASNIFNGLAAGVYTVYFKDNINCTGSQSFTITQPAALGMNVTSQPVVCNGQSNGSITVTASGGTTPYQYSINGSTYQSGGTFNVAAGTYTVYIKDNNGCIKMQPNVTITQPPVLTLSAVTQNATCNGGNDGLITATAGGGSAGFQYSINGINFQSSNIFNVAAGSYIVTVKDANNCSTTTNTTVALNNNLTFTKGNDTTICEGTSAQLQVSSNATQISWTPATALSSSSIATPVASPTTTTQYTVTATLGGCSINGTITVNVNPAPVANAGPDADICFGQDAQLTASGGTSYQWTPVIYLSNASIPNPQVIKPQQSTQYSLSVTDANGCKSLVNDIVSVNIVPPIKVFVGPRDSIVAEGDQIQLTAASIAPNYTWSNAATLSNANISNPVATIPPGSLGSIFTYIVTASTPAGCIGTATVTLKVYKGPDIYMVTGFTPNHDGKNDKFVPFPVGIKKLDFFRVYNRWGQLMFSTTTLNDGWDGNFGGKEQSAGVYVWVVQGVTKDDKVIFKRGAVTLIR